MKISKHNDLINISNISNCQELIEDQEENDDDEGWNFIQVYETHSSQTDILKNAFKYNKGTVKSKHHHRNQTQTYPLKMAFKSATPINKKPKPKMPTLLHKETKSNKPIKSFTKSLPLFQTPKLNKEIFEFQVQKCDDFLSKENVHQIINPQTEYIKVLDSIYTRKIMKISELNKKYDSEWFRWKEYLDEKNNENINNIIYNSVLKDKNEEWKDIEEEFMNQKNHSLMLYNSRSNMIVECFLKEIEEKFKNIEQDIHSRGRNKIIIRRCFGLRTQIYYLGKGFIFFVL